MRQKVLEYLKKPSPSKKADLTTMEQKWVDVQLKAEKPAIKDEKKNDK